jgi:4'-phosphopantetheinyl transferase EntD
MSVRRWIMTGSIAAIAVTGSWYGASLKSDIEAQQARRLLSAPLELSSEQHETPHSRTLELTLLFSSKESAF